MSWSFIALSTTFSVFGQLILKHGMTRIAAEEHRERALILTIALSPRVIGGLFVYGCGVIFWLMAMSYLDVSFVYPFASLSYVGIIVGSYYLFNEHLSRTRLLGIGIIISGVIVIGLSASV